MSVDPLVFSGNRLRLFGFASGLDIDEIVSQLMTVERVPLDRLEQRRQLLVWTKEDLLNINTALDQLRQALLPLRLNSTFQARAVTSSSEGVATASAASGTPEGTYTLTVHQLASRVTLGSSAPITLSPTGDRSTLWSQFNLDPTSHPELSFTLQVTDSRGTHTQTFTFDAAAGHDIYDVVAAINNSQLGLTASYDAALDRLFLSSQESGAHVTLSVTDQTATAYGLIWSDLFKLSSSGSGQDAIFDLNGVVNLRQSTNTFTVAGITYSLKGVGSTTITVAQDQDSIVEAIRSFVDKYNSALQLINAELKERRLYDYPPLTDAQKQEMTEREISLWEAKARQGLLQGNPLLAKIASQMRIDVSSQVTGAGSLYSALSSIGITTGDYREGGLLRIDEQKLRAALTQDPEAVRRLFTASGGSWAEQGVAVRLGATVNSGIEQIRISAGTAGVEVDGSALGRQIADLDEQIQRMEERLRKLEERYYRQFSLMEQVIAQLGSQAMWLSQYFSSGS